MPKIFLSHYGVKVVTHQADSQLVVNFGIVFHMSAPVKLTSVEVFLIKHYRIGVRSVGERSRWFAVQFSKQVNAQE